MLVFINDNDYHLIEGRDIDLSPLSFSASATLSVVRAEHFLPPKS
jgi:hypothetical protein